MISGVERLRKAEHKSNVWNVLCRCLMCCTTQIQLTLLRTVAPKGLQVCKLHGVIARIFTLCSASRFLLCRQLGNLLFYRREPRRWHRHWLGICWGWPDFCHMLAQLFFCSFAQHHCNFRKTLAKVPVSWCCNRPPRVKYDGMCVPEMRCGRCAAVGDGWVFGTRNN